jgi:hypothetical protein
VPRTWLRPRPLEAEIAGAVFVSIGAMAGGQFSEALVGGCIPEFEARACPETVAMLLAIGSVGPDRVGKAAAAAADRLVEAGIPRPGWAASWVSRSPPRNAGA